MGGLSLGPLLEASLRRQGLAKRLRQAQAAIVWPEVAGAAVARHTRAVEVRSGTLWVAVRSSAWAAQLSFLRTDLLAALNRRIGESVLTGLNFRVDATLQPPEPPGAVARSTPPPTAPLPCDAAAIDAAVVPVTDSDIRRAWRTALTAAVVRRRRLEA